MDITVNIQDETIADLARAAARAAFDGRSYDRGCGATLINRAVMAAIEGADVSAAAIAAVRAEIDRAAIEVARDYLRKRMAKALREVEAATEVAGTGPLFADGRPAQ